MGILTDVLMGGLGAVLMTMTFGIVIGVAFRKTPTRRSVRLYCPERDERRNRAA